MSNERGHYGKNGVRVGQQPHTVYVEREGGHSTIGLLLGAVAIGGAVLYARHQSKQIEQLYKTSGLPYESFTGSLRESARAIPTKAREAYRGIAARVRPTSRSAASPTALPAEVPAGVELPTVVETPAAAHSTRFRSSRR